MSYFVYSSEPVPNITLMGKPGYTPEYLQYGSVTLPNIPDGSWTKLPDEFPTLVHKDWMDKRGHTERVRTSDIVANVKVRAEERGVIFLDHEPTEAERKVYEVKSRDANRAFRMRVVEWYENQVREKEVTGQGRTNPTPYEDECYTLLGLTKPYSVEAMRAQRHPGEAVGEQIVAALERLEKRRSAQQPSR